MQPTLSSSMNTSSTIFRQVVPIKGNLNASLLSRCPYTHPSDQARLDRNFKCCLVMFPTKAASIKGDRQQGQRWTERRVLGTICELVELALADIADNLDEVYAPRVYFFSPHFITLQPVSTLSICPQSLLPLHGSPPIPPHELQDQSL